MRYLIAVLLGLIATVVGAEQMLDPPDARSEPSIGLLVRVSKDDIKLGEQAHVARQGDYFELQLHDTSLEYRVARVNARMAAIDAILTSQGIVVSEPDIELGLNESANVTVNAADPGRPGKSNEFTIEFRLDDRQPPPTRPILPSGGEPAPTPM